MSLIVRTRSTQFGIGARLVRKRLIVNDVEMKDIHLALSHGLLQHTSNVLLVDGRGKTDQIRFDRVHREEMSRCVEKETAMLKAGKIMDRCFIDGELFEILMRLIK